MAENNDSFGANVKIGAKKATNEFESINALFTSTAKDSMMAVDAYGHTAEQTLTKMTNGIESKVKGFLDDMLNTDIGGLGSINDAIKKAKETKKDIEALTNQINSSINGTINTINGISNEARSKITNTLYELNKIPNDVMSKISGAKQYINRTTNMYQLNNLIDGINDLWPSGDPMERYVDNNAKLAMSMTMLESAIQMGAIDVVKKINAEYGTTPQILDIFKRNLPTVLAMGDVPMVECITDIMGGDRIMAQIANAPSLLLANYRFPLGTKPDGWKTMSDQLVRTLAKLSKTWYQTTHCGKPVIDLEMFNRVSDDARRILMLNEDYMIPLMVGHDYPTIDKVSLMKKFYPKMAVI